MSVYIGTLGRLVELPYVTSASVTPADRYTFKGTLEGRVRGQAKPVGRRVWSLSASRYLAQAQGNLMSFINGEWGHGPFVWVSSDAPVTNMLTPDVSACGPSALYSTAFTIGGPMVLGGGQVAGRSVISATGSGFCFFGEDRVPVIPGRPVTGSAWVLGAGAKVRLTWYGADNLSIGSTVVSAASGSAAAPVRLAVTATPPAGAVGCLVSVSGARQAARPAVTWTGRVFDWADGAGCPKAIVHGASKDIQSAHLDPNGFRAADMGFTITEVG